MSDQIGHVLTLAQMPGSLQMGIQELQTLLSQENLREPGETCEESGLGLKMTVFSS